MSDDLSFMLNVVNVTSHQALCKYLCAKRNIYELRVNNC